MKTATAIAELRTAYGTTDAVLACGVFDGIHRGHRRIIESVLAMAKATGAAPVVVTFEPHPRAVLQPDKAPQLLTVREQKLRVLAQLGVDAVVFLPFSKAMAALLPNAFLLAHVLSPEVRVRGISVGAGWRFGARGAGDTALLAQFGRQHGFDVRSVPEFRLYGRPVSSTRIREALAAGQLAFAGRLLGRPYAVYGRVVHGKGMGGRDFHCPTANLVNPLILLPRHGVYAAAAHLEEDGRKTHPGIVYVGRAPTVCGEDTTSVPVLEIHLFDVERNLYGRELEVEFIEFLRPDETFTSIAALRAQIGRDIERARQVLG